MSKMLDLAMYTLSKGVDLEASMYHILSSDDPFMAANMAMSASAVQVLAVALAWGVISEF